MCVCGGGGGGGLAKGGLTHAQADCKSCYLHWLSMLALKVTPLVLPGVIHTPLVKY